VTVGGARRPAAAAAAGGGAAGPLAGKSFVLTGTLSAFDRKTAQEKVVALGGDAPGSVTRTLSYLVVGGEERKSSKIAKAEKLIAEGAPLKIISEAEFLEMIGQPRLVG
jgi:DNA ligase (NAD+)